MVATATLQAEPGAPSDGFEQRRLSRAILANQERDGRIQLDLEPVGKDRQRKRMLSVCYSFLTQANVRKKRTSGDHSWIARHVESAQLARRGARTLAEHFVDGNSDTA